MAATNALTYNGFVTAIATLAIYQTTTTGGVVIPNDPEFLALLPDLFNYAELRIQRDLNLLPSLTPRPYTMTTGNQQLTLSVDDFVEVETVQAGGNSLLPVTKEWIFACYPAGSTNAPPQYFAMTGGDLATGGNTSNYLLLAPPPDQNYSTTIYGRIRLPSLYKNNTAPAASTATTFISQYYPDVMVIAGMVYLSLYQRQFSAVSDNSPGMGVNYEAQYKSLIGGGMGEEQRKIFASGAWSSEAPTPLATPSR